MCINETVIEWRGASKQHVLPPALHTPCADMRATPGTGHLTEMAEHSPLLFPLKPPEHLCAFSVDRSTEAPNRWKNSVIPVKPRPLAAPQWGSISSPHLPTLLPSPASRRRLASPSPPSPSSCSAPAPPAVSDAWTRGRQTGSASPPCCAPSWSSKATR